MKITIFDLDHTVIDSSHRQLTREDGSLDLEHWIENCTHQKVMADSLLPLANEMRARYAKGEKIIICTARVMSRADYLFLRVNNLPFDYCLSRPKGCRTTDAELKHSQLTRLFARVGVKARNVEMFDDNEGVLAVMSQAGVKCHDAKKLNKKLAR
jgi:phosphoglycolate phosphatase-like HAD superfamily hydrolase